MRFSERAARRPRRAAFAVLVTVLLCVPVLGPPSASADRADVRKDQWWISLLGLEDAWQHTKGEGVVVAVIDSGVEPSGDLQGAVLEGFSVDGKGPGNEDIDRKAYHGTVMSTLIAGRGTGPGVMGVAPEAKILPVQVPVLNQHEYTAEALTKLAALPDPPEVVNMSYGAFGKCSPDEQAAVNAAIAKDMILVAAIGNVHSTSRGYDHERTPASCKGVIAVGAYGFFGNEASGPTIKMWQGSGVGSEHQPYAALAGPGMRIVSFLPGSTQPTYNTGTSDAAAIVSGGFALLSAQFPEMTSREIVTRALHTAKQGEDGEVSA